MQSNTDIKPYSSKLSTDLFLLQLTLQYMYICTIDRIVYICSKLFMIFIYFKILLYTCTLKVKTLVFTYTHIFTSYTYLPWCFVFYLKVIEVVYLLCETFFMSLIQILQKTWIKSLLRLTPFVVICKLKKKSNVGSKCGYLVNKYLS